MPGDRCQNSKWGNLEIACDMEQPAVQFKDPTAEVEGTQTAEQCAAAVRTHPVVDRILFSQVQPGSEFCFVTGGAGAPGPLVWVTLESVSGSPTFTTTWTVTAWSAPPTG